MLIKALTVGVAALVLALPAAAQQRGTMELGVFVTGASFDRDLTLTTGYGGGGRIGMYLDPMYSFEFEDAELATGRTNGLRDVRAGLLSGRLVVTPFMAGKFSFLVGAGAGISTETNFLHSYGVDVLVGVKYPITPNTAFRVDAVNDWLANNDYKKYQSVRMGFLWYRHPGSTATP